MKIFLQCGIVEHSGHGVPIVVREYGEKAYTFSENMITVTIPFDNPETKSGTKSTAPPILFPHFPMEHKGMCYNL